MTKTNIRRATDRDATELAAVITAAYAPFQNAIPDLPDVSAGIDADIADNIVWIAEQNGRITGGLVAHQSATTFHIANLAVHPTAGGQGIGRTLMQTAGTYARAHAFQSLHLATHPKMPQNIQFYQRLGWQIRETTDFKVLMSKAL